MELIQSNPYRIAGILSNSTERELQKQKTKIIAYSKVGKEIISDYDFEVLKNLTRTEDSIYRAFTKKSKSHFVLVCTALRSQFQARSNYFVTIKKFYTLNSVTS